MSDPLCRYSDISGEFVLGGEEDAGTKDKFWLARKSDAAEFLFKIGRIDSENNAVENWAEAAAAELCEKLGVPPCALPTGRLQQTTRDDFGGFSPLAAPRRESCGGRILDGQ